MIMFRKQTKQTNKWDEINESKRNTYYMRRFHHIVESKPYIIFLTNIFPMQITMDQNICTRIYHFLTTPKIQTPNENENDERRKRKYNHFDK